MNDKDSYDIAINIDQLSDKAFIRQRELLRSRLIPFSASTLWRKVSVGEFPAPIKLSVGITAWRISDIKQWQLDPIGYRANKFVWGEL